MRGTDADLSDSRRTNRLRQHCAYSELSVCLSVQRRRSQWAAELVVRKRLLNDVHQPHYAIDRPTAYTILVLLPTPAPIELLQAVPDSQSVLSVCTRVMYDLRLRAAGGANQSISSSSPVCSCVRRRRRPIGVGRTDGSSKLMVARRWRHRS